MDPQKLLEDCKKNILSRFKTKYEKGLPIEMILGEKVDGVTEIILSMLGGSMVGIVYALEAKDAYSCRHSQRVAQMCINFAEVLELKPSLKKSISLAATIHDIGKIGIPDAVLLCPRRLTDEEFVIMKKHPVIGAEILGKSIDEQNRLTNMGLPVPPLVLKVIDVIKEGILHHHERWDGKGYPSNLQGTDIPYISRIIALADSTDAMLSSRVYRKALQEEDVKAEILKNAGIMYDPELAVVFVENWDKIVGDLYKVTDVQEPGLLEIK